MKRRSVRIAAWTLGVLVLVAVMLGAGVMVAGNTEAGRGWIERLTYRLSSGTVKLSQLGGSFPSALTLGELQLIDRDGAWLTAQNVALTWSPLRLLERRIQIDALQVARLHVERAPVSDGKSGGGGSLPHVDADRVQIERLELGAPLAGTPSTLSVDGNFRLRSLEDADAVVVARRLEDSGDYRLRLHMDSARVEAALTLQEPAGGPLEHLLSLPGLGALSAHLTVQGPRHAEAVDLGVRAGDLRAQLHGVVDLTHRAADVDYSLNAPPMTPRPELSWAGVSLVGNWHGTATQPSASGRLQIDRLQIAGDTRIAKLTTDMTAAAGKLSLDAAVNGLEIPGPEPRLLAKDDVKITATLQLDAPTRPLALTVAHPLFALQGRAQTADPKGGPLTAAVDLRVPELAPFAAFAGQDVRGSALVKMQLTHRAADDAATVNADLSFTGGSAGWLELAGPHVSLQMAGSLSAAAIKIDTLRLGTRAATLAAGGSAERAPPMSGTGPDTRPFLVRFARQLQARWQLDVGNLAMLSSDLAGELKASGTLGGAPASLAADADLGAQLSVRGSPSGAVKATLHVRGLPAAPSGSVQAHGDLDGAPLNLDAAIERQGTDAFHVMVRQADWKSAHVDGDLTADAALTQSHGQLNMRIAQLGDLDRLLGTTIAGSAEGSVRFAPERGQTQAQVQLEGRDLKVGSFAGNVHLRGTGVPAAFGLQMTAEAPDLNALPASLAAAADLDLPAKNLRLASASFAYHDQTVKLLAPAQVTFGKGLSVDDLRIGARDAVLEVRGQISPALDLRASLRQVKPDVIDVFAPGLFTGGLVEAQARLQGTLSSPTGQVRLDATDMRLADDAATGLPALALHATADLAAGAANMTAKLNAGSGSQMTASGNVPLGEGALDVKVGGKLDVGLANPFLEARGMRAGGTLTADASVTGTLSAPQVGGGLTLAAGSLRDFGHGVNLTDITADIVGNAGGLQIKSFDAKAVSGSVGMTGSVGLLQPGLPVDLRITAKNAQAVTSNTLTANLDADVHVAGTAKQRLDVKGVIHVNRATIGIPDSLPPEVAVLDVRRRGTKAPAAATAQLVIGLDVAVQAPQQILVQGRGLDAEMGGEIHVNGTSDAPVASGRLDLLRGNFTIAGNKLVFSQGSNVSFDGEGLRKKIDPTLDFTAQSTIGDTTATLRITGVADAPKFTFSSVPEQPPDTILALLLFGQPAANLSAAQIAQVGYALATLSGATGGGGPLVKLQKSLGLDRLTVGTNTVNTATGGTENSGYAIAAGRYVSKRVYVEGKQTSTGTSQVEVDVDLTKHLKLQTRLGNGSAAVQGTTPDNDPGSSIGISYQFEY